MEGQSCAASLEHEQREYQVTRERVVQAELTHCPIDDSSTI
ncbi:hypothetical protein PEC106568_10120 [Pectobacterium carotovorum subsp. carotovorum]|nr:hypothetical protein PEC106568_10120 [Pectobacterium carotovorum subsp. carotovorum]